MAEWSSTQRTEDVPAAPPIAEVPRAPPNPVPHRSLPVHRQHSARLARAAFSRVSAPQSSTCPRGELSRRNPQHQTARRLLTPYSFADVRSSATAPRQDCRRPATSTQTPERDSHQKSAGPPSIPLESPLQETS